MGYFEAIFSWETRQTCGCCDFIVLVETFGFCSSLCVDIYINL